MLEAICDGKPVRASKDLKGKGLVFRCKDELCEHPELELVAGDHRRAYFRHQRRGKCTCPDGETDWHLEWKSHFDQIEVDMGFDEVTGERNRADALVGGLVLEFQHSPMKDAEKDARERFYGSKGGMLWIVDASNTRSLQRLTRMIRESDYRRASQGQAFDQSYISIYFPYESLPQTWWDRECGIVFDYGEGRKLLYKLPQPAEDFDLICREFEKDELIVALKRDPQYFTKTPRMINAEYQAEVKRKREEANRLNVQKESERRAASRALAEAAMKEQSNRIEARREEFKKLAREARSLAIAKQQGKGRDQAVLEPIGKTGFYITAWGEIGVLDAQRRFVLAKPNFGY